MMTTKSNDGPGSVANTDAATIDSSSSSRESEARPHPPTPSTLSTSSCNALDHYRISALDTDRERSKQLRISCQLECANLRFEDVGIVGREREIAALRVALCRARGKEAKQIEENSSVNPGDGSAGTNVSFGKEFGLISGTSGCGKSHLVSSALKDRVEKSGSLYIHSKYELYLRDEPYFGIGKACSEIVGQVLQLRENGSEDDARKFAMICNELKEEIGDELYLLADIIPPIVKLVGENRVRRGSTARDVNLEQSRERFNFPFRKFIRIITDASIFAKPLVMVLDDLQWADIASLELLERLLTDQESSGLMIVGCYRSEEVDDSHILSKTISTLKDKGQTRKLFKTTELRLNELCPEDVNKILTKLISADDAETAALAELCHRKSMGNPFHLMTFLRMLQDKRLLEFNVGLFRWTFDVDTIEMKTTSTSNVVDIVTSRLKQLPIPMQEVLQIAACLGSSFESDLLHLVWNELGESEDSDIQLDRYLQDAIKQNILEAEGDDSNRFHWVHDKVLEAAMILQASEVNVQFKVGLVLLDKFKEEQLDESAVYVMLNLLQCGNSSSLDESKREEIAKLNGVAAKKAAACSAFRSAAKYIKNGTSLLASNAFDNNYTLALELYSLGAEVESNSGNDAEMEAYCEKVILHAKNPLDKVRCCVAQMYRLAHTKKTEMACELGIDILDELGSCKIPRSSTSQKIKVIKALRNIKDVPTEALHALPTMTDPTLLATMRILSCLRINATIAGDKWMLILASYDMYRLTLKNGFCQKSTSAFTALAIVRCAMNNFNGAKFFADQAFSLLSRFDLKSEMSRACTLYYSIMPWTKPYVSCLKHLLDGYKAGVECGDVEGVSWCITMYLFLSMLSGTNLDSVIADMRTYLPQLQDLGRDIQIMNVNMYFQACLCFAGLSDNPTEMSGEAIPDADEFERDLRSLESKTSLVVYQFHQSFLCVILGDHKKGAELALERGNAYFRLLAGTPQSMLDTLFRGVSLFDMARRTKKMKYKRAAKKTLATMRKWTKAANPNAINKLTFLEAENFALQGKREKASEAYKKSITLSIRSGMVHIAALVSERYGESLLNEIGDVGNASYYLEKSRGFYGDWGAVAKVEQMNKKYSDLWTAPDAIVTLNIKD